MGKLRKIVSTLSLLFLYLVFIRLTYQVYAMVIQYMVLNNIISEVIHNLEFSHLS